MNLDARLELLNRENDELRARCAALEQALSVTEKPLPFEWALTGHEAMVFGVMVNRPIATKEALMAALYCGRVDDEPDQKIVDVFVCKLRKKLKPFDVEIKTIWGRGYALAETDRAKFRELVAP